MKKSSISLSIALLFAGCGNDNDAKHHENSAIGSEGGEESKVEEKKMPPEKVDANHDTFPKATESKSNADEFLAFRDAELENAIRGSLRKPSGPITKANLALLQKFLVRDREITDLSGLENATRLIKLNLHNTQVSNIDSLAGLNKLTGLALNENKITDITPLASLTNLTELYIAGNKIIDITPLADLANLTKLNLGNNSITDISPLAKLTNLSRLSLDGNRINLVTPLTDLNKLILLNLDGNPIPDDQKAMLKKALPNCSIAFGP